MKSPIQQYVERRLKAHKKWPLEIRILHLQEEVGELTDIYLQNQGWKDAPQTDRDFVIALNDVLTELLMIYSAVGADPLVEVEQETSRLE